MQSPTVCFQPQSSGHLTNQDSVHAEPNSVEVPLYGIDRHSIRVHYMCPPMHAGLGGWPELYIQHNRGKSHTSMGISTRVTMAASLNEKT